MGDVVPFESATVARIVRLLVQRKAWYVKTTGVSKVGCPDIIACYRGYFVAIEVKSASGHTSRKQEHELHRIDESGGYTLVARDTKEVELVLDQLLAHAAQEG